jgi:PAS domain S-box-containing protein
LSDDREKADLSAAWHDDDLEDLFENAPCGYLSADPSGRIFKVNATFTAWTGFSAETLVGRRFQELLNIAGRIYYETHFAPLLRMQGFFNEVALDFVCADGQALPTLVNAVGKHDAQGKPLFIRITIFNAKDRRRFERELLEARAKADAANSELEAVNAGLEAKIANALASQAKTEAALRQAQKVEALGQLTGGIAHDFNNMLAVIIAGINLAQKKLARGEDGDKFLKGALEGAQRAASLTNRLLAFSRQLPLKPEVSDINGLVGSMSEILQRTLGETTSVETVLAGGLWKTKVDKGQLENVLLNLAINARDAMPDGGKLTIETANCHLDDDYARQHAEVTPGQYVMLAVSDTGSGMSAEIMAKAFDPFFSTKDVGKGTGLGLSQVHGYIKQSKGHIKIYSEVGHGTSIKIYLPRFYGSVVEAEEIKRADTPRGSLSEVILVVEDDARMREMTVASLKELGFSVIHAESALAALGLLERHPQVALLFTDIVMPDMNGRLLADEALKLRPGLKVIFTTGYTRNAVVHNGVIDAGVNFLPKPFTIDQLGQKVRDVLSHPS